MSERRRSFRAPIRAEVEIETEVLGKLTSVTRELSDTGAFIESIELVGLPIGTHLSVQAVGFPEPMPVLKAEIVRVEGSGVGIRFLL